MRTKVSEKKLALGSILFIASFVCMYYAIFDKAAKTEHRDKFFVIAALVIGRTAVLVLRRDRTKT